MSIALSDPTRHSFIGYKEENEIREIFYHHWEKMKNQMEVAIDGITEWRYQNIRNINAYANEQLHILRTDYNHQRGIFDQKREENVEIAKAHHRTKQTDLFKELCIACRLLEFQVAQLEYVQSQNERPKVITVGEQARKKKQDMTNTRLFECETRPLRSITEDANITEINGGNISRSSVKSISNETNQWSLMTSSSNVNDQSTSNNSNSESCTANGDDSMNKCPICFMIFSFYMTHNDRRRHVNEHMIDDQNGN